MVEDPISPNKKFPSSTVKRVDKYRASAAEQRQFAKDFGPELIPTFSGLSGPIVKPHKNADEGDK